MTKLSFVIPCYRSENTIEKVIQEIKDTVAQREGFSFEVITVNDASPDNVYLVLEKLAQQDKRIKVIDFAKNMGKHAAVLAGFSVAEGEFIINLDDDYQCPVNEFWKLYDLVASDKCDVATAEYYRKKESWFKRLGSNINLRMSEILLDKPKGLRTENLTVFKAFICKEMIKYGGPYPYLEGLLFRVTNRIMTVPMEQRERGDENASGFTLKKSIQLVLNGFTAFSVKPLRLASICGILFAIAGFIFGIYTVVRKLLHPEVLMGYTTITAVLLLGMGLIMIMLGLIGEYLGRIYISINESPQYVIKRTINIDNEEE